MGYDACTAANDYTTASRNFKKAASLFEYLAGQQMAIATLLSKSDTPNYTLVSKLCLGTAELLEQFMATIKSRASNQMPRMDNNFFTLVTFQISMQRSLSNYFLARSFWEAKDYGVGIALMKESMSSLKALP